MEPVLLTLLLACPSGEIDVGEDDTGTAGTTDTEDTETVTDSGTDTATDSGTDTATDTATEPETVWIDVPVTFTGGDPDGLSLALYPYLIDDDLVVGDQEGGEPVSGDPTWLSVPTPDEDDLQELSPLDAPGLLAKFYAVLPFEDDDADGDQDQGWEDIVGGPGDRALVYLGGEVELYFGVEPGFYIFYEDLFGETQFGDVNLGVEVDIWVPTESITLGGTSANLGVAEHSRGVALLPMTLLMGANVDPLDDGESPESWSLTASGEPPDGHEYQLVDDNGQSLTLAGELPVAYTDTDESGDYTTGDSLLAAACQDTYTVLAIYAFAPTYPLYALYFDYGGISLGWQAIAQAPNDSDEDVPVDDPEALVIDPTMCSLE